MLGWLREKKHNYFKSGVCIKRVWIKPWNPVSERMVSCGISIAKYDGKGCFFEVAANTFDHNNKNGPIKKSLDGDISTSNFFILKCSFEHFVIKSLIFWLQILCKLAKHYQRD
jgi:hypothetical protein